MNISYDIDGVLANWVAHFLNAAQEQGFQDQLPPHWTVWDSWIPGDEDMIRKVLEGIDDMDAWIVKAPPHDDAFITTPVHRYITSRSVSSLTTALWLAKHGFPDAEIITVPRGESKVEAVIESDTHVLIDDKPETFEEVNRIPHRTCLLRDRPHNRHVDARWRRIYCLTDVADDRLQTRIRAIHNRIFAL